MNNESTRTKIFIYLLILTAFISISSSAYAKTYKIKGKVKPKLEGVEIQVHGDGLSGPIEVFTTEKGKFEVDGLTNGTYVIFPYKKGYNFKPSAKSVKIKNKNKSITFKDVEAYSGDIIAIHNSKASAYRSDCTASECHEGILSRVSLDRNKEDVHNIPAHIATIEYEVGKKTDKRCIYCHENTDVLTHSAEAIRQNVDPELCANCHGPKGPGKQFYQD